MEEESIIESTNRASPFELPEDERPGSPIPVYRSASSMSDESPEISTFEPIFREVDGDLELNEAWMFCTPRLPRVAILRHPREVALEGEAIILPAIPSDIVRKILNHPSITNPPIEFVVDIEELKDRIEALIH